MLLIDGGCDVEAILKIDEGRKIMDLIQRVLVKLGYSETDGKVYGILLLSPKPLTINEISKITKLSRTTVSTSLSKLVRDYLIQRSKLGRIKLHTAVPAIAEKVSLQPKELLDREIKPLSQLTSKLLNARGNEFKHLENLLEDLKQAENLLLNMVRRKERNLPS